MTSVALQIEIWGYAVEGGFGDVSVRAIERPSDEFPDWDEPRLLDLVKVNGERPPDHFACYWIGEHLRRGHASCQERG